MKARPNVRAALGAAASVACAFACSLALAQPEPPVERAAPGALPASLVTCAVGSGSIAFGGGDVRGLLQAGDAERVADAIVERYPQVEADGNRPQRIALWKKPDGDWLYIALRVDVDRPAGLCYTATFAASRFAFTPALLRRYFGVGGERV